MTWLPDTYSVQVTSKQSIASTHFHITSLEPDRVYNISVISCNMAGCNESCDVHSVQTESEIYIEGETSKQNAPLYTLLNQSVSHVDGGIESPMIDGDIIFTQHTAKV